MDPNHGVNAENRLPRRLCLKASICSGVSPNTKVNRSRTSVSQRDLVADHSDAAQAPSPIYQHQLTTHASLAIELLPGYAIGRAYSKAEGRAIRLGRRNNKTENQESDQASKMFQIRLGSLDYKNDNGEE